MRLFAHPIPSKQTKGTVLLVCLRHKYGAHTVCRPKVTMFAVEMWFGVGDGVECGCSTGLYPLPLGVPRCVIHNKKKCWNEILVILKKNNINHQNHSNNAKKQKNFQMTKHLHRDLSTTNQKNRPFGL